MKSVSDKKENFSKSLMYQIHMTMFLTEKRLEKKLVGISPLTFSQFVILMGVMCQHHESGTQSTLADFLHMTEATISRHIKILSENGYLIKEQSPDNKKMKLLKLTDSGKLLFKKAEQVIQEELDTIFSSLSRKEQQTIYRQFDLLRLSLLKRE